MRCLRKPLQLRLDSLRIGDEGTWGRCVKTEPARDFCVRSQRTNGTDRDGGGTFDSAYICMFKSVILTAIP